MQNSTGVFITTKMSSRRSELCCCEIDVLISESDDDVMSTEIYIIHAHKVLDYTLGIHNIS